MTRLVYPVYDQKGGSFFENHQAKIDSELKFLLARKKAWEQEKQAAIKSGGYDGRLDNVLLELTVEIGKLNSRVVGELLGFEK